jgi:hypothetical protein
MLQNIPIFSNDNLGSVYSLRVARVQDIAAIPDPVDGIVAENITFLGGSGFFSWYFTSETGQVRIRNRQSQEGPRITSELSGFIPRRDAQLQQLMDYCRNHHFVLLIRQGDGKDHLFGSLEQPLRFEVDFETGQNPSSRPGYAFRFFTEGVDVLNRYSGSVTIPGAGQNPAIVRWDDGELIATLNPGETLEVSSGFSHDFNLISAT